LFGTTDFLLVPLGDVRANGLGGAFDLAKNVPLGRLGDPDEIAKAVSFLASDDSALVGLVSATLEGLTAP
jgi:NAD(P)-dependent dehydrogenase (short-subunit alcohol dehydrogenase family)